MDVVTDMIEYTLRYSNELGYMEEFPEDLVVLRMSDKYFAKALKQNENFTLSALSYYDPDDSSRAGAVYINKVDFRYVKIKGPYS